MIQATLVSKKIEAITLANIADVTPEELLDFMHNNYDDVIVCKEGALDVTDIAAAQGFIGWCQNIESFLTPLMAKMDIVIRQLPVTKKAGSEYQMAMSKKYILGLYYDHIKRLYDTVSRQCTLYSTQCNTEYNMDRRSMTVVQDAYAM